MNPAHLHLLLNHVPIIGTLGVILLLAMGVWRQNDGLVRAEQIRLHALSEEEIFYPAALIVGDVVRARASGAMP